MIAKLFKRNLPDGFVVTTVTSFHPGDTPWLVELFAAEEKPENVFLDELAQTLSNSLLVIGQDAHGKVVAGKILRIKPRRYSTSDPFILPEARQYTDIDGAMEKFCLKYVREHPGKYT